MGRSRARAGSPQTLRTCLYVPVIPSQRKGNRGRDWHRDVIPPTALPTVATTPPMTRPTALPAIPEPVPPTWSLPESPVDCGWSLVCGTCTGDGADTRRECVGVCGTVRVMCCVCWRSASGHMGRGRGRRSCGQSHTTSCPPVLNPTSTRHPVVCASVTAVADPSRSRSQLVPFEAPHVPCR